MLLFEFKSFITVFFLYCAYIFSVGDVTHPQRVRLRWRSRGQQGTLGKKRGDDTCAFKNSIWDVKELFSERRRTAEPWPFPDPERSSVPESWRRWAELLPGSSPGCGRAKPGDHVGAVSACVLTPLPPNKHAGEASFLGRKAEFREKWPKPGPRKRRKTWWGTPGNKWFDDSRTTPEVKKLKYWHNQCCQVISVILEGFHVGRIKTGIK